MKFHKKDTLFSFSHSLLVRLTCFKHKPVRARPFLTLTVNYEQEGNHFLFMEFKPRELLKNNSKRE
jgi:hypothetical protein